MESLEKKSNQEQLEDLSKGQLVKKLIRFRNYLEDCEQHDRQNISYIDPQQLSISLSRLKCFYQIFPFLKTDYFRFINKEN
jgi:hypothetical protein